MMLMTKIICQSFKGLCAIVYVTRVADIADLTITVKMRITEWLNLRSVRYYSVQSPSAFSFPISNIKFNNFRVIEVVLEDSSLMRSDIVLTLSFPVRLGTMSSPVGLESSALLLWEPKRLHFICYFMWVWYLICHTKEKREINVIKLYHDIICSSFFFLLVKFLCASLFVLWKSMLFNNVTVWYKLNKCTLWK